MLFITQEFAAVIIYRMIIALVLISSTIPLNVFAKKNISVFFGKTRKTTVLKIIVGVH
jgi:hypothetical protein